MAIIKCPECGQDISDQAGKCVHCGYPLKRSKQPSTKGTHNKVFLFIAIPLLVVAVVFLVLGIMANNSQTRKCFFNNAQFTELHNTLDGTVRKNTTDGSTTISFEKYQCSYGDDLTAVIIFNNGSSQQKVLYRLQSGKINEITMDYSEGDSWIWGFDFSFDGKHLKQTNQRGHISGDASKNLAIGTVELANDIFNGYLDQNCTIEKVYEEYTSYISTADALFTASLIIGIVCAVGGGTVLVLFFVKKRKTV